MLKHWTPQPGDVLAFSGRGLVSATIKLFTWHWCSHIAIIADVPAWQLRNMSENGAFKINSDKLADWNDRPLLFESTTLSDQPCSILGERIKGVQAHEPRERIASYQGEVYLLRLTQPYRNRLRDDDGERRLTGMLLTQIGRKYDGRGAIWSGSRIVTHFWARRKVDRSSIFCSNLLANVMKPVGIYPYGDAKKVTPGRMVDTLLSEEMYAMRENPL